MQDPDTIDPDDEEAVEEMLVKMREHLLADHTVRVLSQEEMTNAVARTFGVFRQTGDTIANLAMVLRRVPSTREMVADHLDEIANMLWGIVPIEDEEEA